MKAGSAVHWALLTTWWGICRELIMSSWEKCRHCWSRKSAIPRCASMSSPYRASNRGLNSFPNISKETLRFPFKKMTRTRAGAGAEVEVDFPRSLTTLCSPETMPLGLASKKHSSRSLRKTTSIRATLPWTLCKKRANPSCRKACPLWKEGKMPSETCFLRMSSQIVI